MEEHEILIQIENILNDYFHPKQENKKDFKQTEIKNNIYNVWPKRFMRCISMPIYIDGIPIRSMCNYVDVQIPFETNSNTRKIILANAGVLSGIYKNIETNIPKFDYYFLFSIDKNEKILGIGDDGLCIGQLNDQTIRVNFENNQIIKYEEI